MRRLLSLLGILHVVHCSCPSGFELVRNGECRGKYTTVTDHWNNWLNIAVSKCTEINGEPIIIHSEEDQNYWSGKAKSSGNYYTVMGLKCNASSKWQWVDGSELDYKAPGHSTAFDGKCNNGETSMIYGEGIWSNIAYTNDNVNPTAIFCTTQLKPLPDPSCNSFEDESDDGVCYQVGETAENWQDAQMICQKRGANLASIHNAQENSFIRRIAVSKGAVNGVFLGATISGIGNEFGWIDGSDWDYANFHSGFPIPGIGDCLAMDTSNSTGPWMNMNCTAKLPFACIREPKAIIEPVCSDGPWAQNVLITSPGFPYSSSTPCDFFLNVEAGKKIEAEIVFLEANTSADFLVLYDGFLGAPVIANLTGEIRNVNYTSSSNLMRVNWAPNGGVNVRGMGITYRAV